MCWKVFRVPTASNTFHTFSNTFVLINLLIHIALAPCGMCWKILGVFFTFFRFCANGENRSRLEFYPAQSLLCLTFVMVILNSDVCLARALALCQLFTACISIPDKSSFLFDKVKFHALATGLVHGMMSTLRQILNFIIGFT